MSLLSRAPDSRPIPLSSGGGEGIDRRINTRSSRQRRVLATVALSLALGATAVAALFLIIERQRPRVDRTTLSVAEVEWKAFQESISATGILFPRTTVYLDAVEGGRVEEIYVREGSLVSRDQPLLKFSNNDLRLRLIAIDAQRLEQINRLRDMRFRLRQSDLELRQQLAEADFRIEQIERQTLRNEKLYESQLISLQEKEQVEAELKYLRRKRDLTVENFRQDSEHQENRIRQMAAEVERMESSYALIQRAMDNIVLKATIAGQLTTLNAEVGELRPIGSRLGQIDALSDGYKVRALVDEFYLGRVTQGQRAVTLPIYGKEYQIVITRVYPEVRDGKFALDLEFGEAAPKGLRRGQTVGFQLDLGTSKKALVLPLGPFYQTTGGRWVFILEGYDLARRQAIRPGRLSPEYLEVVDGLRLGDRVIISSYDLLKDHSQMVLSDEVPK
jgi:HlyD family secretion protein